MVGGFDLTVERTRMFAMLVKVFSLLFDKIGITTNTIITDNQIEASSFLLAWNIS
jgi:hypothetical protein